MQEARLNAGGAWATRFLECGPLVFDTLKSRALIDYDDLRLDEDEFDALFLLAQRAGQTMTLEQLYKAVWQPPDDADNWATARAGMDNVVGCLFASGRGDVWIDRLPLDHFILRLRRCG